MFWEDFWVNLVSIALVVPPFLILLPKFGISKWWVLAIPTGIGTLVLLWVMAYKALPRKEETG